MAKESINADGLITSVSVVSPCRAAGPVTVRFTVRNPTDGPRTFCDYHTPLEGMLNDIFIVTGPTGGEVEFSGIMAKRVAPGKDNHITLQPGDERTAEVNLVDSYALAAGRTTIAFRGGGISGLPDSGPIEVTLG